MKTKSVVVFAIVTCSVLLIVYLLSRINFVTELDRSIVVNNSIDSMIVELQEFDEQGITALRIILIDSEELSNFKNTLLQIKELEETYSTDCRSVAGIGFYFSNNQFIDCEVHRCGARGIVSVGGTDYLSEDFVSMAEQLLVDNSSQLDSLRNAASK